MQDAEQPRAGDGEQRCVLGRHVAMTGREAPLTYLILTSTTLQATPGRKHSTSTT